MRSYRLFFLSMIALAAFTGCEKEGNKKFDAVVDSIAGEYKVSSIYRDDGVSMDLNGDGVAHDNLLEEFDAMPGLDYSLAYSSVYKSYYEGDGNELIKLHFPVQLYGEEYDSITLHLDMALITAYYTVGDDFTVEVGKISGGNPGYMPTEKGIWFDTFGNIKIEVFCTLSEDEGKTVEVVPVTYTFSKFAG